MNWSDVGDWIKDNAGSGAALVGSLLTGNVPGAIAAGVSMVSGVTGTNDPQKALAMLQASPELMLNLERVRNERDTEINRHIEAIALAELKDKQAEHETTAKVVVEGQKAADHWIEKSVRPVMALASMVFSGFYVQGGSADAALLAIVIGPCFAWMGLRTIDKVKVKK
jgi:hypothetical protein